MSYIPVKEGWLYVSSVMDLCTRETVVCEISTRQDLALGMKTLREFSRVVTGAVVLHSAQGTLYSHCAVKRQPDGPTNRHKNDPLVRVGYLLQETA